MAEAAREDTAEFRSSPSVGSRQCRNSGHRYLATPNHARAAPGHPPPAGGRAWSLRQRRRAQLRPPQGPRIGADKHVEQATCLPPEAKLSSHLVLLSPAVALAVQ